MTIESVSVDGVHGCLHIPEQPPIATLALTHGAGSNCDTMLLRTVAEGFAAVGIQVLRFDLAFRMRKPKGPPHPAHAEQDRIGIATVASAVRRMFPAAGPVLLGGHSYGGRQVSMVAAENPTCADGVILFSYPLHPPKKPEKLRIEHLPALRVPAVFVHGSKDEFATTEELRAAIDVVPASTRLVEFEGARHDLAVAKFPVVDKTLAAMSDLFDFSPTAPRLPAEINPGVIDT